MPLAHFVSSGFVGLLVYYLTSTILLRSLSGDIGTPNLVMGVASIHQFSLLLACLSALWVHILEDYTLNLF